MGPKRRARKKRIKTVFEKRGWDVYPKSLFRLNNEQIRELMFRIQHNDELGRNKRQMRNEIQKILRGLSIKPNKVNKTEKTEVVFRVREKKLGGIPGGKGSSLESIFQYRDVKMLV